MKNTDIPLILPVFLTALLFFASCSPTSVFAPKIGIDPVLSFQTASTDRAILVKFRANNNIPGFLGFDIFASSASNLASGLYKSGPSNRSVSLSASAADPDIIHVYRITNDSGLRGLTNGRRYFVWIRAAAVQNGLVVESEASRILPSVPLSNSLFVLNNQNIPSEPGDAVRLTASGVPVLNDCPDTPAPGAVSLFFQLKANGSGFSPYASVFSNGTYIQDIGYAGSITDKNAVPAWPEGYPGQSASVLLVQDHVLALYDSVSGLYAKIHVVSAPGPQVSATASVTCTLRFMVQTIPAMTDF